MLWDINTRMEAEHPNTFCLSKGISREDWQQLPDSIKQWVMEFQATPLGHRSASLSQAYYLLDSQQDFILHSQPDTTITYANPALCQALGCPLEEIIGRRWIDFADPNDLESILQQITQLTPENPSFTAENRDHRAGDRTGWTQWLNQGIFNAQGQLMGLQSVGRDITSLRETERKLRETEERQRLILDFNGVGTWDWDFQQDLLQWNAQTFSLLGINPETTPSYPAFLQVVHPEDVAPLEFALDKALTNQTYYQHQFRVILPDGEIRWLQAQAQGIYSGHQILRVLGVVFDISDRKVIEQALQERETRLRNLAANIPGAIFRYILHPDGTDAVLYMSPGCYQLWGVEAIDAEQDVHLLWQRSHPEDIVALRQSVLTSAQTLQPWSWQWRIITPSGQQKCLQGAGQPQGQDNGDVIWDSLVIDITERKQAEDALRESQHSYQSLISQLPVGIFRTDALGNCLYVNPPWCQITGLTLEEALGMGWSQVLYDEDKALVAQAWQQALQTQSTFRLEHRFQHPNGHIIWVYGQASPEYDSAGCLQGYVGTITDITERKYSEMALQESKELYQLLAENSHDLVCLHAPDCCYVYVSPSCENLLGYRPEDLVGTYPYALYHPEDREWLEAEVLPQIRSGLASPARYRIRHQDGHYVWLETLAKPILDDQGQVLQIQTTSRDISERVRIQDQLKHEAMHDGLTGLPNRNLLVERLELALHRAQRNPQYQFAVLFFDLDRFKVINDSLGHLVGDQVLIEVGHSLQNHLRATDLAARLGGDEFIVLLEDVKGLAEVVLITERILAKLCQPIQIQERDIFLSSSIGIVLNSSHYSEAAEILRDGDIAMYQAKAKGKARYEIFDAEMHREALQRLYLEQDLRQALKHHQFQVYYQPIMAIESGQVYGFEALVRWQHPEKGLLTPKDFIPIAEETGLIVPIDRWVLQTACAQLAQWHQQFPQFQTLKISINLSALDLWLGDLLPEITALQQQWQLPTQAITLEITESMLVENVEKTIILLQQLQHQGIQISIDDFGTGYSSLNYLYQFPVHSLKIDQSFIQAMLDSSRSHKIVETIITLSHQLGIQSIAEGIETPSHLAQLHQLGCEFAQGYLFAKALLPDQATDFLHRILAEKSAPISGSR
ncbi:EAL domain-containing protein [Synechocystis sp. LKSZ1]|uniref:sensor domain-containing protein n=1 Tax=Synechocystis sp. LKSZ1 TaxID=3144951 RepID=UPI00336BED15